MSLRDERKQQTRQALLEAALYLSTLESSFSTISLREVTRHVDLVPTTFYRHFDNMNQLGLELVDHAALHIKSLIHQLKQNYVKNPKSNIHSYVLLFTQALKQHPLHWQFIIRERWSSCLPIRQAIEREIHDLIEDAGNHLLHGNPLSTLASIQKIQTLATVLVNLTFTWAMAWFCIMVHENKEIRLQQQQHLMQEIANQVDLIFYEFIH